MKRAVEKVVKQEDKKAIVIGSGIAAAIRLTAKGYAVNDIEVRIRLG